MQDSITLSNININSSGRWLLKTNMDPKKFRLTNIDSFVPKGKLAKDKLKFKNGSGEDTDTLFISKLVIPLKPDNSEIDRHNVKVLIQHYNVGIEGLSEEENRKLIQGGWKVSNPKFTLVNIDKVENEQFEEKSKILKARTLLYNSSSDKKLTIQKLIWLCSTFGLSHMSHISDPEKRKQQLILILDKFIEKSIENSEKFINSVDNIKLTERIYYINEFRMHGIITSVAGVNKIGDRVVGSDDTHIMEFYDSNPEIYLAHQKAIIDSSKS